MGLLNNTPEKKVTRLAKKSDEVAAPFSDMLKDAQVHHTNLVLFEQDLDEQISDLILQKERLGLEISKNAQFIDKLNNLFN